MPNQEMLDRMPEVSQNTIEKTLAGQIEGLQNKVDHRECQERWRSHSVIRAAQAERIAELEVENGQLREALEKKEGV